MKKLLLTILLLLAIPVHAQITVQQGGTGTTSIPTGFIPFGNINNLRINASSSLTWNNTNGLLTITGSASSTNIFGANLTPCTPSTTTFLSWSNGKFACSSVTFPTPVAGGVDTNVQYNSAFAFGGNNNFVYLYSTSGNVGIGTSTPFSKLQVMSTSRPQLVLSDFTGGKDAKHAYASSTLGQLSFGKMSDTFALTEYARFGVTGNFGVGTTTPGARLSIHGGNEYIGGNSFIAGTITSTSSGASRIPYASSTALTVSGTGYMGGLGVGTSTPGSLFAVQGSGNFSSNLFVGGTITSTSSNASTIPYASTTSFTSAGSAYLGTNGSYLGFGTAAPTNPFSFIYNDNNFANGMILRNSNSGSFAINGMQFQGSDSSTKANFAYFSSSYADPTVADKMAFYTPNTTTGLAFVTNLPSSSGNTGDIRFSINNPGSSLNGITIRGSDGSGNVGVGTTSPYKILSVQGLGSATTTIVHGGKSNPSCDQYFSPNGTAYRTYMSNAGALTTEAGFCQ